MQSNDELFTLIKSMTKNEKGYFRKFSGIYSTKGGGNYLKLFDCINRMDEYNDEAVRKEFKGEKILKQLGVTKYYLKNMVIRALRNFHEEHLPGVANPVALADINIMLYKGLFQSARNRILKEKEKALKNEAFLQALQLQTQYDRLLIISGQLTEFNKTGAPVLHEKEELMEKYINFSGYMYLKSAVIPFSNKPNRRQLNQINQLLKHPLLSSDKMPQSYQALANYSELAHRLYLLTGDYDKAMQVSKAHYDYLVKHVNHQKQNPFSFFIAINYYIFFLSRNDTAKIASLIGQCKKILAENTGLLESNLQITIQTYILFYEMKLSLFLHKPAEAIKSGARLEGYFKSLDYIREEEMALFILQAMAYTALNQFDKALDRLNRIFHAKYNERSDLLGDAHLLNIIVHVELGNYAILKRQFSIAKYFIKKNAPLAETELIILNELEKFSKTMQSADKKAIKAGARNFLTPFKANKIWFKEFLEDWLETKI
jgi:hypothetical protein